MRTSTDAGALLVQDTDDPKALAVTESTSPLALRVRESTSPLAMRVRGLFSPASLPGLAAWYDAADSSTVLTTVSPDVPATDGQTVRRWLDKSGNNRHLDEGDLTDQPTWTGQRIAYATTTTDMMHTLASAIAQPLTVYIAMRNNAVEANRVAIGLRTDGDNWTAVFMTGSPIEYRLGSGGVSLSGGPQLTTNEIVLTAIWNGASSSLRATGSATVASGNAGTAGADYIRIFRRPNNTNTNNQTYAEIAMYQAAHDVATRDRVIQYLRNKWGIAA